MFSSLGSLLPVPHCRPCASTKLAQPMDTERVEQDYTPWNELPIEIVELVFSHLDVSSLCAATQVCRRFSQARWQHIDLSTHCDLPTDAFPVIMQKLPMTLIIPRLTTTRALPITVLELFQGTVLNLRNCKLPANGLDVLAAHHKSELRELCLANCNIHAGNVRIVAQLIAASPNLQLLDLSDNAITIAALDQLSRNIPLLPRLRRLVLSDNDLRPAAAVPLAELLRRCPALEELHVDEVGLGDQGCAILTEQHIRLPQLRWLSLGDNDITGTGMQHLAKCIKQWTSPLRKLDIHANSLGNDGATVLATLLETNTTLNTLILWDNRIGDPGAHALADVLFRNTSVHNVDLKFNAITSGGAGCFARVLERNTTLQSLGLRFNMVEDDGARALAIALQRNSALAKLDLEENGITNVGAAALGSALQHNHGLQDLKLKNNVIGDVGCRGLALGLVRNRSLKKLDLTATGPNSDRSGITSSGLRELAQALQHNNRLHELVLTGVASTTRLSQPLTRLFARAEHCQVVFQRATTIRRLKRVRRRRRVFSWFSV